MKKITKSDMLNKIISGGQTGVDRAALDVAIELGLQHGGYCNKSRLSEDGIIPERYNLIALQSDKYSDRTLQNVQESDGTLILHKGDIIGGTNFTEKCCLKERKAIIKFNVLDEVHIIKVNFINWVEKNNIFILNIAGPRESECYIYKDAQLLLQNLFREDRLSNFVI